jgi:hypothetical protein
LSYIFTTTAVTATDKQGVLADTSGGSFTVTLPATPSTGAQVIVADAGANWGTNNLTVGRNGSTIGGLAENLICDITGASVQFVYDGSTWEVYAQIGGNGGTVVTLDGVQTLTNKTFGNSTTFSAGTVSAPAITTSGDTNTGIFFPAADTIAFAEGGVEAMRLDASGNLLVGTTSAAPSIATGVQVQSSDWASQFYTTAIAGSGLCLSARRNNNGVVAGFLFNGPTFASAVGNISITASATAYNTSSDYRLKEQVQPMTGALAKVAALKPCIYKWKVDGSNGEGFIAHELAEIVPDCVTGEKDAVDAKGKPAYQGIDTSFLVATLTAAIQELKADLDVVKAELAALKGA